MPSVPQFSLWLLQSSASSFAASKPSVELAGWLGLVSPVSLQRVSDDALHIRRIPSSILTEQPVFTVTIAVGIQDRPSAAPKEGVWKSDYKIVNHPKFTDAVAAISSMIFSYAGTPGFFSIAAEMRDPRHYTRSLVVCQTIITVVYITVGVVMYYYCGSYVASPAIGSAGPLLKKVGYGIGLPGLIASLLLLLHVRSPL